ncbi:hypothetical protein BX616_007635 [Lobosporangium transversale]|uniref:Uncharacterized protein n=1 Tax=Lobosporangium transversale TaxID=64571 RepID=A0A1Y2GFG3_9FUNG|nr:hypothetical protein BCR41DRAFT_359788 [Lobosporangium transversale]KAF9914747.1 hypothetical protein BX616_007635 [Lobosporangium transversale]ORZ08015.1 hypothetical protein BCR41DRAFT_359788 [Lobosporangium transversale]|eukprot:XP_021878249.1 hypothetical protein BCR41DRAFT_359788 [Lobosporangium transversale]
MATYKQRTHYNRQTGGYSSEQDLPASQHATAGKHTSESILSSSSHAAALSHINPADDILLDDALDQEWTSIRHHNTSGAARARARQQLYLHQEQQRAQEWSFVLGQRHQRPSLSGAVTGSIRSNSTETFTHETGTLSSDEGDDVRDSLTELATTAIGPRGRDAMSLRLHETHSRRRDRASSIGTLSYSDFTSEGLESIEGESEDPSIWSQDDDEGHLSSSNTATPRLSARRITPASPYTGSSPSTTSLNNMIHPSFAQHLSGVGNRFHTQMLFHDGAGNFVMNTSTPSSSRVGSDHESELYTGWESSSSTSSSIKHRQRQQKHREQWSEKGWVTKSKGPVSPGEFDTVINNISLLQDRYVPSSHQKQLLAASPSTQRSTLGYSHSHHHLPSPPPSTATIATSTSKYSKRRPGPSKLSKCNIYEAEMEDIDAMVIDIPAKQSWLQVFESALSTFRSREVELDLDDSSHINPIKALARHASYDDTDLVGLSKTLVPEYLSDNTPVKMRRRSWSNSTTINKNPCTNTIASSSVDSMGSNATNMKRIKQQVSASSLEALKRLQAWHRTSYQDYGKAHQPFSAVTAASTVPIESVHSEHLDPMQVHFPPTVPDNLRDDAPRTQAIKPSSNQGAESERQGQTSGERDSNLLAAVISTLRRFGDHVKSNLLHPEFDEDTSNYLAGLGFEGDLGIEWATGRGAPLALLENNNAVSSHGHQPHHQGSRRSQSALDNYPSTTITTSSTFMSQSTSSALPKRLSIRRNGSDCGLESMFHNQTRESAVNTTTSY